MSANKEKYVVNRILQVIGSSEFTVLINGIPRKFGNSYVYVKRSPKRQNEEPNIIFFTKYRTENRTFEEVPAKLRETVMGDIMDGTLFGLNFSEWVKQHEKDDQFLIKVAVNNSLKFLFIETSMYNIFRENIPKRTNLNVRFQPTLHGGQELSAFELADLLNRFRMNGFRSLIELERAGLSRRLSKRIPKFYRMGDAHFLTMIKEVNLYNPFFDDMMIYPAIQDRKIIKAMQERSVNYEQSGLSSTYLSAYQVCQSLGIKSLVPMNFIVLISLMVGFVMEPDALPITFPHKGKVVYRNVRLGQNEFPPVISEDEWRAGSDYKRGEFVNSTSYNTFFLNNSAFFSSRGFRDINKLLDVMAEATLL